MGAQFETVFICPPPKRRDCCPSCASPRPRVHACGMVARLPGIAREQWERDQENRRLLGALRLKREPIALWRLHAYRCQDCRHDQVWDTETDEWWDLDHTDYLPEGSR